MGVDNSVDKKFVSISFFSDLVCHAVWLSLPCGVITKDIFARELFAVLFSALLQHVPQGFRE
jgi:hypothetical protein